MDAVLALVTDPSAWAALLTLIVMEVVLGIDNLLFISILTNKLPEENRHTARRIGIGLALVFRLLLLGSVAWIVQLTTPIFDLGLQGALNEHGAPSFETAFSWRDLILIAGGLFLVWKATKEINQHMDPDVPDEEDVAAAFTGGVGAAIGQIVLLDLVFSIDSILTAVGMTDQVPLMVIAVIVAIAVMLAFADVVADFIESNPTIVMLALAFLMMIGTVLVADGFGVHVPKGYIYVAMAFSAFVEGLNMVRRRREERVAT